MDEIEARLGLPTFIKPSRIGSSVGVSKARTRAELQSALDLAAEYDDRIYGEVRGEACTDAGDEIRANKSSHRCRERVRDAAALHGDAPGAGESTERPNEEEARDERSDEGGGVDRDPPIRLADAHQERDGDQQDRAESELDRERARRNESALALGEYSGEPGLHVGAGDRLRRCADAEAEADDGRGAQRAHVVVDMPFGSYQTGWQDALRNATRIMQETGCGSVKLEGGERSAETVRHLVDAGIPVMGHIGLTPQSVNALGGYKVQGKTDDAAARVIADAKALEDAGAYAIVLETVPAEMGAKITQQLRVPTIGIGAGPYTSGQVQVVHDLLGLFQGIGLPFQSDSAPVQMPNMVWLYRVPILLYWAEHDETLGHIITHVLVHEIGHHFGLSDDDMDAIERLAG